MNTEKLISKGVEKHFNGQEVLFKVSSLNEHFEGLQIHESDAIFVDGVEFVKVGDVNFDNATANEVSPKVEEETEDFPVWVNPPLDEIEVVSETVTADILPTETVVVEENVLAGELNTEV